MTEDKDSGLSRTLAIDSCLAVIGHLPGLWDQDAIRIEPMLFNCDFSAARKLGGPITKAFMDELPRAWRYAPLVIDSRVHMLMPGWFPCIPGWHHDDVPRTRADGQPNYGPGQDRSEHVMALVNGSVCPTEFALGRAEFVEPPIGVTLYETWHREVEAKIAAGLLNRIRVPTSTMIKFDDRAWHQGTAAISNGWRFFIRASRYFDDAGQPIARRNPRTNEVRRQVQVYLADPFKGW